jgi:hypothetical protein
LQEEEMGEKLQKKAGVYIKREKGRVRQAGRQPGTRKEGKAHRNER